MLSKAFENEFLKNLELLNKKQQERVLTFIKSLLKAKSNNQQELLQFAGNLNTNEAQEIRTAIELGCEKIDKNDW